MKTRPPQSQPEEILRIHPPADRTSLLRLYAAPLPTFLSPMQGNGFYKAVIWDMDGLLIDSERFALQALQSAARAAGSEIDLPLFQSLIGLNSAATRTRLEAVLGPSIDVEKLTQAAAARYRTLTKEGVPLKPGARRCLHFLRQRQVPQALATSSSNPHASQKLQSHQLLHLFQAVVTGDQVKNGKPHPEPYLLAAQRLGVEPRRCMAFEDSVNGIQSAKTAGAFTILVPDICPHPAESLARVDQQFETLTEALPLLQETFPPAN